MRRWIRWMRCDAHTLHQPVAGGRESRVSGHCVPDVDNHVVVIGENDDVGTSTAVQAVDSCTADQPFPAGCLAAQVVVAVDSVIASATEDRVTTGPVNNRF